MEDPNKVISIYDCIKEYSKEEILGNDNMAKCDKCNERVKAKKKDSIYKAPPILIVNLSRFDTNITITGFQGTKKDDKVDFPLENLEI
jgi:ubiquitin carboxyl-terminal hydrolase 4/11/15